MKFFNLDSPLMKFLNRMTDVLWLNILTILSCILIIPAGAGFTALHYVCLKMVRDEEGYITKDFFKSFKKNFKQATIIWLIILAVAFLIYVDYKCLTTEELLASLTISPVVLLAAIGAACLFILFTVLYVFPVLSHFENTVKGTIRNSFFMSVLALPRTLLMIVLNILPLAIIYCVEYFETMTWLIPLTVLFWFSAPAYFSAKLYNKTFKKFEPEDNGVTDDLEWTVNKDEAAATPEGIEKTEE